MPPETGYLRIATEEAFAPPELVALWQAMLADGTADDPGFVSLQGFFMRNQAEWPAAVLARLQDLGDRRLADMDAAGIDRQVISLTAVAPQDPEAAAREIERGARELDLVGVIINSHTQGEYLDDPKFWPIFEAAQALDTPIYLHPNTPSRPGCTCCASSRPGSSIISRGCGSWSGTWGRRCRPGCTGWTSCTPRR